MFDEGVDFQFINLMSQFKGMDSLTEQLKFILVLLYSLDSDKQDLFYENIKKFEEIQSDMEFMRQVKYRDSLVKDYASEYFGKDYADDDPFIYMPQLENKINEISLEIMNVLGMVIKSLSKEQIFIPEDT